MSNFPDELMRWPFDSRSVFDGANHLSSYAEHLSDNNPILDSSVEAFFNSDASGRGASAIKAGLTALSDEFKRRRDCFNDLADIMNHFAWRMDEVHDTWASNVAAAHALDDKGQLGVGVGGHDLFHLSNPFDDGPSEGDINRVRGALEQCITDVRLAALRATTDLIIAAQRLSNPTSQGWGTDGRPLSPLGTLIAGDSAAYGYARDAGWFASPSLDVRGDPAFLALMDAAGSDEERSYLLRGAAAGHSVAELTAFAAAIRGKSHDDLQRMLNVIDTSGGVGVERPGLGQLYSNCSLASVEVVEAQRDPVFALFLTGGAGVINPWQGHDDDPDYVPANQNMAFDQQMKVVEGGGEFDPTASNYTQQGEGGLSQDQIDVELNRYSNQTGLQFTTLEVSGANMDQAIGVIEQNVDSGLPVPLGLDGHEVVAVGHQPGYIQIHDSATGMTGWLTEDQIRTGDMGRWSDGADGMPATTLKEVEVPTLVHG